MAQSPHREEAEESGDDNDQQLVEQEELFQLPSGNPARFLLHDSLTTGMKAEAIRIIESHGGEITQREKRTHVILVAETRLAIPLERLQRKYDVNPDLTIKAIWVKPFAFLKQCTHSGVFQLSENRRKSGMPGTKRPYRT